MHCNRNLEMMSDFMSTWSKNFTKISDLQLQKYKVVDAGRVNRMTR